MAHLHAGAGWCVQGVWQQMLLLVTDDTLHRSPVPARHRYLGTTVLPLSPPVLPYTGISRYKSEQIQQTDVKQTRPQLMQERARTDRNLNLHILAGLSHFMFKSNIYLVHLVDI